MFPHDYNLRKTEIQQLTNAGAVAGFLTALGYNTSVRQKMTSAALRFSEALSRELTFLYRLLFLLYAESRDLLPVREIRRYWEISLAKMREEIAQKAGSFGDEAEESPAALRPLRSALAWTDALNDQIADRLYGLTEGEIAIVAGGTRHG